MPHLVMPYDGYNAVQELSAGGAPTAFLLTSLGLDETFTRTDGNRTNTLLGDAEVVITTPSIPGLELQIPAQTVIRGKDGNPVTQVSITAIRGSAAVPAAKNVEMPVYSRFNRGHVRAERMHDAQL